MKLAARTTSSLWNKLGLIFLGVLILLIKLIFRTQTSHQLPAARRVLVVGDSQSAGRGAGTGAVAMDGARQLSWPTKLRDGLIAAGYAASSESFSDANNTGGTLDGYDPRVSTGSFTPSTSLKSMGGRTMRSNSSGALVFSPSIPVDTFELLYPVDSFGTAHAYLDGPVSATQTIDGTGIPELKKAVFSTSTGMRSIYIKRLAGTSHVISAIAYQEGAKEFRIINVAARSWSTTDWLVDDAPFSPFPSIATILSADDIALIMLGVNDIRQGGVENDYPTWYSNMETLITNMVAQDASVILAVPMPIDQRMEGSFSFDQLIFGYRSLAAKFHLQLYRGDLALGSWEAASSQGKVADSLHWRAPAFAIYGDDLVPYIINEAFGLHPVNIIQPGIAGVAEVGQVLTVTPGTWTNNPSNVQYQWYKDSALVPGASIASYTIKPEDLGRRLGCYVISSNSSGTGYATSPTLDIVGTAAVFFADSFATLPDGSALSGRVADTGGTWTTATADFLAQDGRIFPSGSGAKAKGPASAGGNYSVAASLVCVDVGRSLFVAARYQNGSNFLAAGFQNSLGGWTILKRIAGVNTVIAGPIAHNPAPNDVTLVELIVDADQASLKVDGVIILSCTITDAILLLPGSPGLYGASATSSTSGWHVDSFLVASV